MNTRRHLPTHSVGLSIFFLFFSACAALPGRASLIVRSGAEPQKRLVETLYRHDVPEKFRPAQPILVRFLMDDAMNASIRNGDPQESDDDRDTIDGIYQDDPPSILLRSSRPSSELSLVFLHEYGHFVWGSLLSENQRAVFRSLYALDKGGHRLVSDYAEVSPEEGFAETFGVYVLHPKRLTGLEPRIYAFLSALAFPSHDGTGPADTRPGREWEETDPAP